MGKRAKHTVKIFFITTLSSLPFDDTAVTHVIGIGINWNLGDECVVTNDERVVN